MMDFEGMICKWRQHLLDYDVAPRAWKDEEEQGVLWLAKTMGPNLWNDIPWDKSADLTTTYRRIHRMAREFASADSDVYQNEEVKDAILYALQWMYENRYSEKQIEDTPDSWRSPRQFNWWDWEIGSPGCIVSILMLMAEHIPLSERKAYLKLYHMIVPRIKDYGSNKLNYVIQHLGSAILAHDEALALDTMTYLEDMFQYCDGEYVWNRRNQRENDGQGFYSDGTYIYHTLHPLNGIYGLEFYTQAINLYQRLVGTSLAFSEEVSDKLKLWYKTSFMPFVQYGNFARIMAGREPECVKSLAVKVIRYGLRYLECFGSDVQVEAFIRQQIPYLDKVEFLESCAESEAEILERICSESETLSERETFSKAYWFADKVLHQKKDYTFVISMSSSRVFNYECINNENMTGWYIADGMTNLYTATNRYLDTYWEEVNPYLIPGTTVDTQERQAVSIRQSNEYLSGEDFVGAVVFDNRYLTAAMCLESYHSDGEFSPKDLFSKSPLTYGGKPPKHDCSLKARKAWFCFDDEIVCLGSAVSAEDGFEVLTVVENLPYEANVIDDKRFYIPNTGVYMVLDDKTLTYDKGAFTAVINHGINPHNDSYAYAILPNCDVKEVNAVTAEVLVNEPHMQAVRCKDITGIVFYEAGEYEGVKADSPCIVMHDGKSLYVSDPTHKLDKITVQFQGKEYIVYPQYGETICIF